MLTTKSGSANFNKKSAAIKKANKASYPPKGGSDNDEKSHGSRPSHINSSK